MRQIQPLICQCPVAQELPLLAAPDCYRQQCDLDLPYAAAHRFGVELLASQLEGVVALALSLLACKTCTIISMVINFREIYRSLG